MRQRLLLGLQGSRLERHGSARCRGVATVESGHYLAPLDGVSGPHKHGANIGGNELRAQACLNHGSSVADIPANRADSAQPLAVTDVTSLG